MYITAATSFDPCPFLIHTISGSLNKFALIAPVRSFDLLHSLRVLFDRSSQKGNGLISVPEKKGKMPNDKT